MHEHRINSIQELVPNFSESRYTKENPSLLECLSVSKEIRYALPGSPIGYADGYAAYFRKNPAYVWHYKNGNIIPLNHDELILVGMKKYHCISISYNDGGIVKDCYVNINLPAVPTRLGWAWYDLELDLRLDLSAHSDWSVTLLDLEELLAVPLSEPHTRIATAEVRAICDVIEKQNFPTRDLRNRIWDLDKMISTFS